MFDFSFLHDIFYVFAGVAIVSATYVITARNPVRSVLALVITFLAIAGVWMILDAEFLSLILILVYVGAVMTLFLFVIMMLNIDTEYLATGFVNYLPFGIFIVVMLIALMLVALGSHYFGVSQMPLPPPEAANYNNIKSLGEILYVDYALPFELAGVILLAAIIAAITLAHRGPHQRKVQNVSDQISANPKDRVRLVKMPAEPKMEDQAP